MLNRRNFLSGVTALSAFCGLPISEALAAKKKKKKFKVNPKYAPQTVRFRGRYWRGTIVIDPHKRFLYLVEGRGRARRYGVGVGKAALAWSGTAKIKRKAKWPSWTPTQSMIKREPAKYAKYAGGVPGGPNNPLGARALYLYKGTVTHIIASTVQLRLGQLVQHHQMAVSA